MLTRCASSKLKFGALREVMAREREGALFVVESLVRRCGALSGEHAPNSVRAEGGLIVDKPG